MGDTSKILPEGESSRMTSRQQLLRVGYLGVCFCLLFTAFSTARSYLTTVFPKYGYWSFFMMYIGFMIGSVSAVPLLQRASLRQVMFGASLTYVVFLTLINSGVVVLFLGSSLTMGMGAGAIWVAQATYVVRVSNLGEMQIGRLTAIFFAIWSLSSLFGSSLAILAIRMGLAASGVFWVMSGVCTLSCTMFFFVRNIPTKPRELISTSDIIRRLIALVPRMPPYLIIYGMQQGFGLLLSWAVLPTLVSPDLDKISIVIVAYSISATGMSYVWGYLFDRYGLLAMLLGHFINGVIVGACVLGITASHAPWEVHIVSGIVCGSFDQCNNNMITTLVKHSLPDCADMGVSVYRLSFAVSIVLFSTVALYVPYYVFVVLCLAILTLAFSLFLTSRHRLRRRRRNALPPLPTPAAALDEAEALPGSDSPVHLAPNPLFATHSALALIAQQTTLTLSQEKNVPGRHLDVRGQYVGEDEGEFVGEGESECVGGWVSECPSGVTSVNGEGDFVRVGSASSTEKVVSNKSDEYEMVTAAQSGLASEVEEEESVCVLDPEDDDLGDDVEQGDTVRLID